MHATSPKKRKSFPGLKRGGQPANANALKHGIYSRHYTPAEFRALDKDVAGSLKDEMEILLLTIAETADSVLQQPEADIPFLDHVSALRTIAVAIARLENVVQTRMVVLGDPDRREKQVNAILDKMEQEEIAEGLEGQSGPAQVGEVSLAAAGSDRSAFQPPKKKSGGQPGNSNAWKHGFYACAFTPAEKDRMQVGELDQLRHEETLLRILILRTWRSSRSARLTITYQEYLFTLRSVCYAIFVISKLQRARRRLFGDKTDLEKDIQLGITDACADLGVADYLNQQVKK